MLSAELEQKVRAMTGCHAQTVKAAKKDLGVESYQSGQRWYSRLPGQGIENGQGTINDRDRDLLYPDFFVVG
jgi:predicted secreted protein